MSDGDTELRDLVSNTLENAGVLAKIRAELRANVFLVLEEHEAFKGRNISFANKPLKDFLGTQEGIITVSLMREFLEYFGLEFSASVFEPETQAGRDYEYVGRSKLAHDLKLNAGKKTPLIAQVLQESKICFPTIIPAQKDFQNYLDNGIKKDKVKEEKKEVLGSSALRADVHSNGFAKSGEVTIGGQADSKECRPLLANSPPSFQNHMKKPDTLKLDMSPIGGKSAVVGALSTLGSLPPLGPPLSNTTSKGGGNKNGKQVTNDIKALLDLGSGSPENNYEEDFHASGSEKASKGTNRSLSGSGSEVEEDMSAGMDDQTSDNGSSNGSNKTSGDS